MKTIVYIKYSSSNVPKLEEVEKRFPKDIPFPGCVPQARELKNLADQTTN